MQKWIRIPAIIAAALAGFSLLLLVATVPYQRVIATTLYDHPASTLTALPQFPTLPFVMCLLRTTCIALLIICCGNQKGGIWLELVILGLLIIALPLTNHLFSQIYNALIVQLKGTAYLVSNTVVNTISILCMAPCNLGQPLAYVACGMSIAFKTMCNRKNT